MKKNFFLKWAFVSLMATALVACEKDDEKNGDYSASDDEKNSGYAVLVVNQGNYRESNGSLSTISAKGEVTNQVYKDANGEPLASIIESVVDCGSCWALICNNEDKIELVNKKSFKREKVIKGIATPRYGVCREGVLYVTSCDFGAVENHLYAVDLADGSKKEIASIEGQPEGIVCHDGYLWMAASSYDANTWSNYDPVVYRYRLSDFSSSAYLLKDVQMGAKHLSVDEKGSVWVSLTAYGTDGKVAKVDTVSKTLTEMIDASSMTLAGHICMNAGKIYYLSGLGNGGADEETSIRTIDLNSKTTQTVASGNGFYGFGVNATNGYIYTANVAGFTTNSTLSVFNAKGESQSHDELLGVGACRFLFPKW